MLSFATRCGAGCRPARPKRDKAETETVNLPKSLWKLGFSRGCSSVVERYLAKVDVVSSNLITRFRRPFGPVFLWIKAVQQSSPATPTRRAAPENRPAVGVTRPGGGRKPGLGSGRDGSPSPHPRDGAQSRALHSNRDFLPLPHPGADGRDPGLGGDAEAVQLPHPGHALHRARQRFGQNHRLGPDPPGVQRPDGVADQE